MTSPQVNLVKPFEDTPFPYHDLADSEIRLVEILPKARDNTINCQLKQFPLEECPKFCALSYAWGDQSVKKTIVLDNIPFKVTRNLYEALLQLGSCLESRYFTRYIWIDAICINQDDFDEKSVQVPRMADLYNEASQVVIWVGPNPPPWDASIGRLFSAARRIRREILEGGQTDAYLKSYPLEREVGSSVGQICLDLLDISSRSWFSRIWTVQEACINMEDPDLYAGQHYVGLYDLMAILIVTSAQQTGQAQLCMQLRQMVATRLLYKRTKDAQEYGAERGLSSSNLPDFLFEILLRLAGRKANLPVDHLYGVLALLECFEREDLPVELMPNYNLLYEDVYVQYASFLLNRTGDLRLLDCHKRDLSGVPSWVPDFRYLGGSTVPQRHRPSPTRVLGGILHVEGFTTGQILSSINGIEHADLSLSGTGSLQTLSRRFEEFERSILQYSTTLKKTTFDKTLEVWLQFAFDHFGGVRPGELAQIRKKYDILRSEVGLKSLRGRKMEVQLSLQPEHVIITMLWCAYFVLNDGSIGMTKRSDVSVQQSDVICLLKGAGIPAIIRRKPGNRDRFEFEGFCEIFGNPPDTRQQKLSETIFAGTDCRSFCLV